jgi:hypothetical protein
MNVDQKLVSAAGHSTSRNKAYVMQFETQGSTIGAHTENSVFMTTI